jgi:hypothetical protein
MRPGAALMLGLLALAPQGESPGPGPPAGADEARAEPARVVWRYDTGG